MAKTLGIFEAKPHFGEVLRDVERGETIVVTRHGVPIAHITPAGKDRSDVAAAIDELHRFRRERRPTLDGVTVRELIAEGRL